VAVAVHRAALTAIENAVAPDVIGALRGRLERVLAER